MKVWLLSRDSSFHYSGLKILDAETLETVVTASEISIRFAFGVDENVAKVKVVGTKKTDPEYEEDWIVERIIVGEVE